MHRQTILRHTLKTHLKPVLDVLTLGRYFIPKIDYRPDLKYCTKTGSDFL